MRTLPIPGFAITGAIIPASVRLCTIIRNMNNIPLHDPGSFFRELGGLHDAGIIQVIWDAVGRTLSVQVDDLNANFEGLPEYGGRVEATFTFKAVENFLLSCDSFEGDVQRIYRIEVLAEQELARYVVTIQISPSGRLVFTCGAVAVLKEINCQVVDENKSA